MSLLVRNVQIVGGDQKYPDRIDVFINNNKISAIGNFPNKGADEVLDGQRAYLSPGFIDVNTDSDHYLSLFDYPEQEDFLRQGVTTIAGGMCGSSLAPLIYGGLESVQKWGDIRKVNVDWHTVDSFLKLLEKRSLAVNFVTLAGHSTIRRDIVGEQIRALTKNELLVFERALRQALEEGAFGMSTGLGYVHGHKTPYPELKFLANIVKEYNGVYATHLRETGKGIEESVDETIRLTQETGVKTLISHFLPIVGSEKEYRRALDKIKTLPQELDFHFDLYPSDTSVFAMYTFLPDWAKSGGRDKMLADIRDEWKQPRIVKDFQDIDAENFTVAQAPGKEFLVGRSLQDLCSIYNTADCKTALLRLMLATELRGIIFYKNINGSLIEQAIVHPKSLIASNAASYPYDGRVLKPERAVSTFTKFLTMVARDKIMPLEEAINKITAEPARKFGLQGRGKIKEGNFADLTLFSFKESPAAAGKRAEIHAVVVNGKVVLRDGGFRSSFNGRALRHRR